MGFVSDILGNLTGSNQAAEGVQQAAQTQAGASAAGIAAQNAQFNKIVELMAPFVTAGTNAIGAQQNLLGLNGNDAQQTAINAIQNSPEFAAYRQQGENSILQNASATGGLRSGNTQAALAKFSPQLLNALIQQRFGNLGGLAQIGQAGAAGQAAAGQAAGNNIAGLLAQQGAATAGGQIAKGNAGQNAFGSTLGLAGILGSLYLGGLGGSGAASGGITGGFGASGASGGFLV